MRLAQYNDDTPCHWPTPAPGFGGLFDQEGFFGGSLDQWASLSLILLVGLTLYDRVVPPRKRENPRRRR
jgi:hypothetical protein